MKNLALVLILLLPFFAIAQSKSQLRTNKIKSRTIEKTEQKDGQTITYKDAYEEYDKNGRTIIKIDYSRSGEIKKQENFKFDSFGNEIEKIEYERKTGLTLKTVSKFDANGVKIEEIVYDSGGQVLQKQTYSSDNRGLRKESKEYNAKGELRWKKTYSYTTF